MADKTEEHVEVIELLMLKDVQRMFNVSEMTILNWRKTLALPTVVIKGKQRNAVRFRPEKVLEWSKANHKPIINPL